MDPRHNPNPRSTSTHTHRDVQSPHIVRASSAEPRAHLISSNKQLGQLQVDSGIGSGSSSSKFRPSSFGTTPSSSQLRSPSTPITPPDSAASPGTTSAVTDLKHVPLAAVTSQPVQVCNPSAARPLTPPPKQSSADSHSASSDSDEQLPTRSSIRAWAKATPAGPPRDTPSPSRSALFAQSSSDDSPDRRSITRSALNPSASSLFRGSGSPLASVSSGSGSESGPGSGATSGDEDNTGLGSGLGLLQLLAEESSGNIADVESAGSDCLSPPENLSDPSPCTSPPPIPHARPPLQQSARLQLRSSSSDEGPALTHLVVSQAHAQDQQDRLDRRGHRHPPQQVLTARRRHRDRDRERDRRSRVSNPTPPNNIPAHSPSQVQGQDHSAPQTRTFGTGMGPALRPLRLMPELRLPPPPPPGRLTPLQIAPTTGGLDVLDEIARMLHTSRRPLVRVNESDLVRPRRENDVLDDICFMIRTQRA